MNENKCTTLQYSVDSQKKDKPFLQTGEAYEYTKTLNFIRDRLVEAHGEPKNLDYMHKLNNAIMFVESVEGAKAAMGGNESMRMTVDIPECEMDMHEKVLHDACNKFSCIPSYLNKNIDDLMRINKEYAAALSNTFSPDKESKPKRTNVEYVKCDYGNKASNAVMDFENNAPLYKMVSDEYWAIDELDDLFSIILDGGEHIYRRVETEMTEREEFIEVGVKELDLIKNNSIAKNMLGKIFDSGKFKLVD